MVGVVVLDHRHSIWGDTRVDDLAEYEHMIAAVCAFADAALERRERVGQLWVVVVRICELTAAEFVGSLGCEAHGQRFVLSPQNVDGEPHRRGKRWMAAGVAREKESHTRRPE
jgi:hypothetical protein